jgi:membrane associated rhomboid family serine protease
VFPLRDANPRHGPPIVTWGLVLINLAVFGYQLTLGEGRELFVHFVRFGFIPSQFFQAPIPEAPTLLTSMFLHGGITHIVGNLFFLVVFGDNVEDRLGHARFLLFYLLGGAAATLTHGLFAVGSNVPMIGASGAISAVLGAYVVLFPRQRVLTLIPPLIVPWMVLRLFGRIPRFFLPWLPAWIYIGYWAAMQLLEATNGILVGASDAAGVAWWAHVGGFGFGLLALRWLYRPPRPEPESA